MRHWLRGMWIGAIIGLILTMIVLVFTSANNISVCCLDEGTIENFAEITPHHYLSGIFNSGIENYAGLIFLDIVVDVVVLAIIGLFIGLLFRRRKK